MLKKNAVLHKIFQRKSNIEKMLNWKLREGEASSKPESVIFEEVVHLLAKNFRVEGLPKVRLNPQRQKDLKFLARGKGNTLLWKGKKINLRRATRVNSKLKFVNRKSKGFFLDLKSKSQNKHFVKNLHLINKSLEVKPRVSSIVKSVNNRSRSTGTFSIWGPLQCKKESKDTPKKSIKWG